MPLGTGAALAIGGTVVVGGGFALYLANRDDDPVGVGKVSDGGGGMGGGLGYYGGREMDRAAAAAAAGGTSVASGGSSTTGGPTQPSPSAPAPQSTSGAPPPGADAAAAQAFPGAAAAGSTMQDTFAKPSAAKPSIFVQPVNVGARPNINLDGGAMGSGALTFGSRPPAQPAPAFTVAAPIKPAAFAQTVINRPAPPPVMIAPEVRPAAAFAKMAISKPTQQAPSAGETFVKASPAAPAPAQTPFMSQKRSGSDVLTR